MNYPVNPNAQQYKDNGYKILVVCLPMTGAMSYTKFWLSFLGVFSADNIWKLETEHKIKVIIHHEPHFPIDFNRNHSLDIALHSYLADYILLLDTDMTFPQNTVFKLLEHLSDEYPITVGMYYKKGAPYKCVHGRYNTERPLSEEVVRALDEQGFIKDGKQYLYHKNINYFDKDTPFEVDAIGAGCVLARREAFEKIKQPYFRYSYDPERCDSYLSNNSEDMWFSAQLAMNGVKILCVPQVQCGHIGNEVITVEHMEAYRDGSLQKLKETNPEMYEKALQEMVSVK